MKRTYENYEDPVLGVFDDEMPLWFMVIELVCLVGLPTVLITNILMNMPILTIVAIGLFFGILCAAIYSGKRGWT